MIWLLLILASLAFAQDPTYPTPTENFKHLGWITGCVNDRPGTIRFLGACTPRTNSRPTATWYPEVPGPCKFWAGSNTGVPTKIVGPNGSVNAYSTQTPFSYKNKYILLGEFASGGFSNVYNLKTCAEVWTTPANVNVGKSAWSNYDPEVLYFLHTTNKTLSKRNIAAATTEVLITFNGTNGYPNLTGITLDGTGDMTKDEWMVIHSEAQTTMCTVNLNVYPNPPAYCINYSAHVPSTPNFLMPSRGVDSVSNLRYIMFVADNSVASTSLWSWSDASPTPAFVTIIEDTSVIGTGDRDGAYEPGETIMDEHHSMMAETADGRQIFIAPDIADVAGNNWISFGYLHYGANAFGRESAGGGLRNIYLSGGYRGSHFGSARHAPYFLVSNVTISAANGIPRNYGDTSTAITVDSPSRTLIVGWDAGREIYLVGNTHGEVIDSPPNAVGGSNLGESYWPHPFGSMSMDGSLIAFQSTFGKDDYINVAVVEWMRDPKNIRAIARTTDGFTLKYVAPNDTACTRKIDNDADFSSPLLNESDGGGNVQRSKTWTGGASGTLYYIRVTCGTQNADSSQRTL